MSDTVISLPKYGPSLASIQWLTFCDFLPPSRFTRRQIQSTEGVAIILCFNQGMGKVLLEHSHRGNNNSSNNALLSLYFTVILNSLARSGDMKGSSGCEM